MSKHNALAEGSASSPVVFRRQRRFRALGMCPYSALDWRSFPAPVQQPGDLGQRHPRLLILANSDQPLEVLPRIVLSSSGPGRSGQQLTLHVVAHRAPAYPSQSGQVRDSVFFVATGPAHSVFSSVLFKHDIKVSRCQVSSCRKAKSKKKYGGEVSWRKLNAQLV